MLNKIFEDVQQLNKKDHRFLTTEVKLVKINEELGELSAAFLIDRGYKLSKDHTINSNTREHLLEEASDVLIQILSIIDGEGFTEEEIKNMVKLKLAKWETNLQELQEKLKSKFDKSV